MFARDNRYRIALSLCAKFAMVGAILASASQLSAQDSDSTGQPVAPPPVKGLIWLFKGSADDVSNNWVQRGRPAHWPVEDGVMTAQGSDMETRDKFTDYQLHVEFRIPYLPDKKGQERGNSGVFMQGRYEIQVLDSYGINEPGTGDCGAVYHQAAPLVNACRRPMQWQTYDIAYRAPRFDPASHQILEKARVSVFQNGIAVQKDQDIQGLTHISAPPKPGQPTPPMEDLSTPGPIRLQYHGAAVSFRNIWILPEPTQGASHYEPH